MRTKTFGSTDVERNAYFFLYYPLLSNQRCTIFSTVNDIDSSLTNTNDSILTLIIFLVKLFRISADTLILNATMNLKKIFCSIL